MQIYMIFQCRQCNGDVVVRTDTADYDGEWKPLRCTACGHASGDILQEYRFLEEHRPSHERDT
jgi:DNA-directed RNA polymerase subunit RPC12/RpoP